jgi:hypothetical protein
MVIDSVNLSTTAQRLGALLPALANINAGEVHLQSASANTGITIFIGNANVATTKGYELAPGGVLRVFAGDGDVVPSQVWAVASSGTPRLNVVVQDQ